MGSLCCCCPKSEQKKDHAKHKQNGGNGAVNKTKAKEGKEGSFSETDKQSKSDKKVPTDEEVEKEFKLVESVIAPKGYKIVCNIGSGNYAEVYKAHSAEGKEVAVKVIHLRKVSVEYREKLLRTELEVVKKIKHKNIVKTYELSQHLNRIFIVMEFAPNGTCADWLKSKGVLNEQSAHSMFTEILEGLHFLHSQRIGHRDLKLENILLSKELKPKISDFSYAIVVDPNNPLNTTFCGSLPYFSPEILQRLPYNPLISDIWSIGVCFYIMLNDSLPFKLGDDKLMLKKQLNREWKFKDKSQQISDDLKNIIRKMLEPEVDKRITTEILMSDPWIVSKH